MSTQRKRTRTDTKEPEAKKRRVEVSIPTEISREHDLFKLSALYRENPEKYNKKLIYKHLHDSWPYQTVRGEKTLWDIVQELGDEAENLQCKFEQEREKSLQMECDTEDEHSCGSDGDDSYPCSCFGCNEDRYCPAFIDSVNIAVFYDLQTDQIIGPLSLSCVAMSKKNIKNLDTDDISTKRAVEDGKKIHSFNENNSVVCLFSK